MIAEKRKLFCLPAFNEEVCQLPSTMHAQHTIYIAMLLSVPVLYDSVCPALALYNCCTAARMQGTVIWRARLSSSDLPKGETHFFLQGNMIATFYQISSDQYVWTVGAPVSCLEAVGLSAKTGPTGPKADAKGKLDPPEGKRSDAQGDGQVAKSFAAETGSADSQQQAKDESGATQAEQAQNRSCGQPVAKAAELSASEVCL